MKILETRKVKFSDITFGDRARENYGDIEDLALSIRDQGLMHPPVVDQDMNLIAGGRRYKALELLNSSDPDNWTEVTVTIAQTDGELDAKEAELTENLVRQDLTWWEYSQLVKEIDSYYREKTGGEWDYSKTGEIIGKSIGSVSQNIQLAERVQEMPELKKEESADAAYKKSNALLEKVASNELKKRLAAKKEKEEAEGSTSVETRKYQEADEAFQIGDVFEGLASLPNSDSSLIMAEIDPPYGIALADQKKHNEEVYTDGYVEEEGATYPDFLRRLCNELYRVLPPGSTFIFWFGIEWYDALLSALDESGLKADHIPAIWYKGHGQTNKQKITLARTYETFLYGRKPGGENVGISKLGRQNVFSFSTVAGRLKRHPTQKPVDLLEELIWTFCLDVSPDKRILVPFMGSGATYFAARKIGMKAFGWDLFPEYKDRFLLALQEEYYNKLKVD